LNQDNLNERARSKQDWSTSEREAKQDWSTSEREARAVERRDEAKQNHEYNLAEIEARAKNQPASGKNHPVRIHTANGYLPFNNGYDAEDFADFVDKSIPEEVLKNGIDDTLTDRQKKEIREENKQRFLDDNALELYEKWQNARPLDLNSQQRSDTLSLRGDNILFSPNDSMRIDSPAISHPRMPQNPQDDEDFGLI
jgi:hypothetical protein